MASVNLQGGKCGKRKALYGIPRHNYRVGQNHSNKDIDPTRSHLNRHYGPQTAEEFREKLRGMIEAADAKKPPKRQKKDRQVMLCADIPSPREGMSPEDELKWSEAQKEVMEELFPGLIVGGSYHADEIHEYTDPHDHQKHISRGHTHWGILPVTDSKGLNMDEFYKRTLPNKINAALDAKCQELFGYSFRDGTQAKSRGTVEQMKLQSEIAAKEEELGKAEEHLSNTLYKEQEAQEAVKELEKQNKYLLKQNEALRGEYEALEGKYEALEGEYKDLEAQTVATKEELAEAKSAFSRFMEKVADWVRSHEGLRKVLQGSPLLSKVNRAKIGQRMEKTVERGDKAISKASESAEDLIAAEDELEKGKRTFDVLKTAAKQDLDIDELLESGWDYDD